MCVIVRLSLSTSSRVVQFGQRRDGQGKLVEADGNQEADQKYSPCL